MAYSADLAGSKLRAKLGASLNESVSAPTSAFAQRHLQKLGWTEGTGLGKHRSGRVSHVKVQKREDQVGLGHTSKSSADAGANTDTWWKDSLGDTLAKLTKKKRKHVTDEDLLEATGGARFGMRGRATAKFARTESTVSERDEEEAIAQVEWNGTGPARTLLKKGSKSKSCETQSTERDVKGDGHEKTKKENKKAKKKKKEKRKQRDSSA